MSSKKPPLLAPGEDFPSRNFPTRQQDHQPELIPGSSHHHSHSHSSASLVVTRSTASVTVLSILALALLTIGMTLAVTWPAHHLHAIPAQYQDHQGGAIHTESGSLRSVVLSNCSNPLFNRVLRDPPQVSPHSSGSCFQATVMITSGPDIHRYVLLEIPSNHVTQGLPSDSTQEMRRVIRPGPGQPSLHTGDHIRLISHTGPEGRSYNFDDFQRGIPMLVWAGIFALVVAAVSGWRGVRALLGLAVAFVVLALYTVPSLLNGSAATMVAVVSALAILSLVLPLAHGINWRTGSALLGTMIALGITALVGWLMIDTTHASGLSSENDSYLQAYLGDIFMPGVLLAGFIIGSLGVINDVTITQASVVFEFANAHLSRAKIFRSAMRVGRDHIASTVYTLLFAYIGGALPLFLLLSVSGRPFLDLITSDGVATEFARSVVGGIGLALSVPLTTAVAVSLIPSKKTIRHLQGENVV